MDIEQNDLLATARELGVAIVAYSPVGRGFLTGKFQKFEDLPEDDWRRQNPRYALFLLSIDICFSLFQSLYRFMGENFTKNLEIVKRFEELAKEMGGFTPSQVCLSWLMAQGNDIIPIPGTTKVKNLEENWASVNIKLTDDQLQSVRKIVESIGVQGTRYPASNSSSLNK